MITKDQIINLLSDIRFWIILYFIIRLIGITNAPLELGHNWRQSLTNMIARNFLEYDFNLFYPTIDMAGTKTGIIGSEFPFFNFLIYLTALVFDYQHWYGRIINLIISSIGIFYFYKIIKLLFNKNIAFNATIILLSSIWFAFSRKIMPDTFSVAIVIIGLYYAVDFIKTNNKISLTLFLIFCTLGVLCKIPTLCLVSGIGIILFVKEIDLRKKMSLILTGLVCLTVICAWYFYWVPYLVEHHHFQLYFPKGIKEGWKEIIIFFPEVLEKFYFSSLHSYIAFACFLGGIFLVIKSKNNIFIGSIGIIAFVFFIFIIKTGSVFPLHNYYIIPFTPVMSLIAGYFIANIRIKYQYVLLFLIAAEGIANQQHDFFVRKSQLYKLELEEKVEKVIPRNELIVINGGPSPQDIYFSNRKGWTIESDELNDINYIDSLSALGARYLIIDRSNWDRSFSQYQIEYTDNNYTIYKLE